MRNIAITLEYDGKHFSGFQIQKNRRTVQSELEAALKKLFSSKKRGGSAAQFSGQRKIQTIVSGRTDSGVHAEAQVVNFKIKENLPLHKIQLGLNYYLAEDVAVTHIREVPISFHAQFSAKWKTYEYRILNSRIRSPLKRERTFQIPYELNLAQMKRAVKILSGKHDFRAFEAAGARRKSAVRTIRTFTIEQKGNDLIVTVEANGFLYNMVRSLVGTLIQIGRGKMTLEDLKKVFISKKRSSIGPTVPARGLILKKVTY